MKKNTLINRRIQHPIGQGCFHSGEIEVNETIFRYVYDCGSKNSNVLKREIQRYLSGFSETDQVDVLFVSHLDEDHVSDIEKLLIAIDIKTAVIPYLSPLHRIMLIAEFAPSAGSSLARFAMNPTEWFQSLGVQQVLHVSGGGEDGDEREGGVEFIPDPDQVLQRAVEERAQLPMELLYRKANFGEVGEERVYDIHSLNIRYDNGFLPWTFFTHVYDDGATARNLLWTELVNAFPELNGLDLDNELVAWIKDTLKNKSSRERLKQCYKTLDHDHNRISMSLYSGPIPDMPMKATSFSTSNRRKNCCRYCYNHWRYQIGWMGTGDSDLRVDGPWWRDFKRHFSACFNAASTVLLPHHGSSHSYPKGLAKCLPVVFVVSAGENNQYGHPHHDVILDVLSGGGEFICVTESRHTGYYEVVKSTYAS